MARVRLAIINGYTQAARDGFREAGIVQAEELFAALFGRLLPEADLEVLFPAGDDFQPPDLERYAGYVWTGSSGTIYKDAPENDRQLELMKGMFRGDRPVWGSCWGLQVAAAAAGGEVGPSRNRREWMAARRVRLSEAGREHRMYQGKVGEFDSFVMHLDEVVRVPEGSVLLASNHHSPVQALEITVGACTFWGTQYHPEFDFANMARLIVSRAEAMLREGLAAHPDEFHEVARLLHRLGDLAAQNHALTEEEFLAHPELTELGRLLDLHWSIMGRDQLEAELRNWITHVLRPSLAARS